MNTKTVIAAWLMTGWVCGLAVAADIPAPAACMAGLTDSPDAPLALKAELKESGPTGVICRVHITNTGSVPQSLRVCPKSYLCTVANLHPIVGFGDTGMGLIDLCSGAKSQEAHEVFLLPESTLSMTVRVPADRIPKQAGKAFQLAFCYAFEAGKVVHSNAITVDTP